MIISRFFLSKFDNKDFITKRKARVFLYYSGLMLILLSLLFLLYTVMPISPDLAKKGYIGALAISVLVIISLCFLRTGSLNLAVWSYAVPTIIVTILLRMINGPAAPETAFSTYIFYMPYLIVYVAVFGKKWHVIFVTFLFASTNWIVWAIVRDAGPALDATSSTGIINSTMGLLTTGVLSYSLISIVENYAVMLRSDADESAGKVERIKSALDTARSGLQTGETLMKEAESMTNAASVIGKGIETMRVDVNSLRNDVSSTASANEEVSRSAAVLSHSTEQYLSKTMHSSSAVAEMTASIGSIKEVCIKTRDSVESLAKSISDGIQSVQDSASTVDSLISSGTALQDVVSVITSISDQTNILAMNAAIEAAHAGESGKGFAVVAEEIRHLAEETAANTKTISDGLNNLFKEISKAEKANTNIDSAFKGISAGIEHTTSVFNDILAGMNNLASGTADINSSVSEVVSASKEMSNSILKINEMIEHNTASIKNINEKSLRTLSSLESITQNYNSITVHTNGVRDLGKQSDSVFKALDESIRAI